MVIYTLGLAVLGSANLQAAHEFNSSARPCLQLATAAKKPAPFSLQSAVLTLNLFYIHLQAQECQNMQLGLRTSLEKDTGAIWRQPCRNAALAFAWDAVWVTLLPWKHVCRERKDSFTDITCLFLHPLSTLKENFWPFSLAKVDHESVADDSVPWVPEGGYPKVRLGVHLDLPCCRGISLKRQECRKRFIHCKQPMIFGVCIGWLWFFSLYFE